MALKWPPKDPDETLDFSVDWSRYLDGDTITSVVWYCVDENGVKQRFNDTQTINGLQRASASNTDTVAVLQLALGTVNTMYHIYCQITTSGLVTTERKINLRVRQRD